MTVEERRIREKDVRRENTICVACELFYSKGFENVSLDMIANEADLAKTTLYSYFKDKNSIYLAVVKYGILLLKKIITEEEQKLHTSNIVVGNNHIALNRFINEYPNFAHAYLNIWLGCLDLSQLQNHNKEAKDILRFNDEFTEKIILEIKDGIDNKVFKQEMHPASIFALNLIIQYGFLSYRPNLLRLITKNGITLNLFTQEVTSFVHLAAVNQKK